MSESPVVLVVEDETALSALLRYNLEKEGFRVVECGDGREALDAVSQFEPNLLLLDWMIPSLSGIEVCRRLRRSPATRDLPIILLTARGEEADRIRGLDQGADDYITKPFSIVELMARIRAVLRRTRSALAEEKLVVSDLAMDLTRHRVTRSGRAIRLGPTEYRLLRFFMEHPGRVFSRDHLLEAVWGRHIYVEPRTIDVHIRRLRKVLNGPDEADMIRTVRSAGYALDTGASSR